MTPQNPLHVLRGYYAPQLRDTAILGTHGPLWVCLDSSGFAVQVRARTRRAVKHIVSVRWPSATFASSASASARWLLA